MNRYYPLKSLETPTFLDFFPFLFSISLKKSGQLKIWQKWNKIKPISTKKMVFVFSFNFPNLFFGIFSLLPSFLL